MTQKIWLGLPFGHCIADAYRHNSTYLMASTGVNTGNLVFRKSISSLVNDWHDFLPVTWGHASDMTFADDSLTIISCANWLGVSKQDEASNLNRARVVERIKGKCLVLGLGAQATNIQDIVLGPNTARLAHALAARTPLISVRDAYTQAILAGVGITNVSVTGCPSNMINLKLNKDAFESRYFSSNATWDTLKILISEASGGSPDSGRVIKHIYSILAKSRGSSYVLQSPALLPLLYKESRELHRMHELASELSQEQTKDLLIQHSRVFASVDDWLFAARFYDFSFGMRIHGTMVPLQAGVPSILVTHDKRTSGLADTMCIPSISSADLGKSLDTLSPTDLLKTFSNLVDSYLERRAELATKFSQVISSSGFALYSEFAEYCGA